MAKNAKMKDSTISIESPVIWQDRTVGRENVAPDQLVANPNNWRIHTRAQERALAGVLESVGLVDDVIVNVTTQHVVNGHLRVAMAISSGQPTIPVRYIEITAAEEDLVLATFDPLSMMAGQDKELAKDLLDRLVEEGISNDQRIADLLDNVRDQVGLLVRQTNEWDGMPEFEQGDATSWAQIIVHFAGPEDRHKFAELVGQKLSENTKSIWFPEALQANATATSRYTSES